MKKIALVTNHLTPFRKFFYEKMYHKCKDIGFDFKVFLMTKCEPQRNWNYDELKTEYSYLMKDIHLSFPINNHINLEIKKKLRQFNPDIVIMAGSYMYVTNWFVCSLRKKLDFKLLYWNEAHFNEIRNYNCITLKIREIIRRKFFSKIDGFWYSGQMSLQFCKHYSFGHKDFFFLPNLVDNEIYSKPFVTSEEKREKLKRKWNVFKKIILIPARLSKEKAIDKFIYMVKKCKGIQNYTILIAGTGNCKETVKTAIEQTTLDVRLLGFQQQDVMQELFSIADIFVLPSLSDSNPLSCIEALWAGLPLIVSKHVGNHPEVVQDNGCVFDYEKADQSIALIDEILQADNEWFKKARIVSRNIAIKTYNPDSVTERIINEMSDKYFK